MKHFIDNLVDKSELPEHYNIYQKRQKIKTIFSLFVKLLVDGNLKTSESEEYDGDISKIKNILVRIETFVSENEDILMKVLNSYEENRK